MKVILAQHGGQAAGINLNRPPKVIEFRGIGRTQSRGTQGPRRGGYFCAFQRYKLWKGAR